MAHKPKAKPAAPKAAAPDTVRVARVPPVAPAPTYTRPAAKKAKPKGEPGPIKRLVKFIRGDYTKP